jgi:uncharacterized protein (UPF0335 family)
MNRKIRLLERTYLLILVSIFLLIAFTPYIIQSGFTVLEEQLTEVATIILLFAIGYAVLFLYRKEVDRNLNKLNRLEEEKGTLKNSLTEAFKYIGTLNIQIQEIKSVFSGIRKFPENKKDFGYILQFLADRTLSMVNAGWVLFRIIDTENLNSLGEFSETRGNSMLPQYKISNKILISNEKLKGFTVVGSGHENFYIKAFCIIPKAEISNDDEVFVKAVVNQVEMLFLIFLLQR